MFMLLRVCPQSVTTFAGSSGPSVDDQMVAHTPPAVVHPAGDTGNRVVDAAKFIDSGQRLVSQTTQTFNWDWLQLLNVGFVVCRIAKRSPPGFLGMRGKKADDDARSGTDFETLLSRYWQLLSNVSFPNGRDELQPHYNYCLSQLIAQFDRFQRPPPQSAGAFASLEYDDDDIDEVYGGASSLLSSPLPSSKSAKRAPVGFAGKYAPLR